MCHSFCFTFLYCLYISDFIVSILTLYYMHLVMTITKLICVLIFYFATHRIRRIFRQEKIFTNFACARRWQNFFPRNFCQVKKCPPWGVLTVIFLASTSSSTSLLSYFQVASRRGLVDPARLPAIIRGSEAPTLLSIAPHSELRKARSEGPISSWMRRLR